ncbi:bifunctional 3,4-dihydroxy-2-butanone-4-phosphate synthase/GTP cyclohydrolase II [Sciscionella sediminilitoris]|uniref:bifunctional 3,4-dihydroxy-2-butanone-4-phosphate synthase/GTP cyclohydrolase II n=1 Tax=Sciscionella sediminilitoris TaxID=1445613 RepID=UPI0004DFA662|nr:bifunctional 3,4-dihydroxy-2-butanone-4-phosphate synthase/GTP cyclohydrolase II [Sciscionella sp. SE31]
MEEDRVAQALAALRDGWPALVTDARDREDEGDVVLAAHAVTPDWVAWTVRHTSGLLCAPMTPRRAADLRLPLMVEHNEDTRGTAYTVTVDARTGVTTGISAADRARTLRALADSSATAADFVRPGHILPLRARAGGVLERPGHTEAAVDLCRLAGLAPVAAIAELVDDDGSMLRGPGVEALGRRFDLPTLTIAELISYRQRHPLPVAEQPRVVRTAETELPTEYGQFRALGYLDLQTGAEHVALVRGELQDPATTRVHSECLTGESLHSQRCDCGPQLHDALRRIGQEGGVLVYLRGHEGRAIGLQKKLTAYELQDTGLDTVDANLHLGEPADAREYGAAAAILHDLGVANVQLLTNNPVKVEAIEASGVAVVDRLPLTVGAAPTNLHYLATKQHRMGHLLDQREIS